MLAQAISRSSGFDVTRSLDSPHVWRPACFIFRLRDAWLSVHAFSWSHLCLVNRFLVHSPGLFLADWSSVCRSCVFLADRGSCPPPPHPACLFTRLRLSLPLARSLVCLVTRLLGLLLGRLFAWSSVDSLSDDLFQHPVIRRWVESPCSNARSRRSASHVACARSFARERTFPQALRAIRQPQRRCASLSGNQ